MRPFTAVCTSSCCCLAIKRLDYLQSIGWAPMPSLTLMQKVHAMSNSGLFSMFAGDHLLQFSLLFRERVYARGEYLVEEHHHAHGVSIVVAGRVALWGKSRSHEPLPAYGRYKQAKLQVASGATANTAGTVASPRAKPPRRSKSRHGHDLRFAIVESGGLFGLGVALGQTEPFTAIAETTVTVLSLSKDLVRTLILGQNTANNRQQSALTKVRYRHCAAEMRDNFKQQVDFAQQRRRELLNEIKSTRRTISNALQFRVHRNKRTKATSSEPPPAKKLTPPDKEVSLPETGQPTEYRDSATGTLAMHSSLAMQHRHCKSKQRPTSAHPATRITLHSAKKTVVKLKHLDHEQRLRYGILPSATSIRGTNTKRAGRKNLRPRSAPLKRRQQQAHSLAKLEAAEGGKYGGDLTIRYQRLLNVNEHRVYHRRRLQRVILGNH